MFKYAAFYDSESNKWKVIYMTNEEEGTWFVFLPDAGDKETAKEIARRMAL